MGWDAYMAKGSWEEYWEEGNPNAFVYGDGILNDPLIKSAVENAANELLTYSEMINCCLSLAELCGGLWLFEQVVGEPTYTADNKDGRLYWPPEKVQQVYKRIKHSIERDRIRFADNEYDAGYYEQIRLFLKVSAENDLGILFTW